MHRSIVRQNPGRSGRTETPLAKRVPRKRDDKPRGGRPGSKSNPADDAAPSTPGGEAAKAETSHPSAMSEPPAMAASPSAKARRIPIVGVGASAGGLEAFSELLRHLPARTGMAFVLVQHLDPTHGSVLKEILSRTTEMPVTEVTDGVEVEPDHVYVIPANKQMVIRGKALRLAARSLV